jgi:UDP-N-acetylglucosamine 2-epimerase (non-hydrolysing)
MRLVHVVGARPNFVKIAPIMSALSEGADVEQSLVHTGQHYDPDMSQVFFDDLGLPPPDVKLGIHSDLHGAQTGRMMIELEQTFVHLQPDCVLVVGDVDSTMAAALVATKLRIPCAHVDARGDQSPRNRQSCRPAPHTLGRCG